LWPYCIVVITVVTPTRGPPGWDRMYCIVTYAVLCMVEGATKSHPAITSYTAPPKKNSLL
jgi:hypothetical protein